MVSVRNVLAIVLLATTNSLMAESLCLDGEQIVFSCTVKKRIASVCASTPLTKDKGNMQYRFGTKSNIEFQFPPAPSPQGKHFYLSSTAYGGGGETHLRFTNDAFEYIIYERTTKGEEDPQGVRPTSFNEGIFVKKSGKKIAQYKCDGDANAGVSAVVYDVLPTEPFRHIALGEK